MTLQHQPLKFKSHQWQKLVLKSGLVQNCLKRFSLKYGSMRFGAVNWIIWTPLLVEDLVSVSINVTFGKMKLCYMHFGKSYALNFQQNKDGTVISTNSPCIQQWTCNLWYELFLQFSSFANYGEKCLWWLKIFLPNHIAIRCPYASWFSLEYKDMVSGKFSS